MLKVTFPMPDLTFKNETLRYKTRSNFSLHAIEVYFRFNFERDKTLILHASKIVTKEYVEFLWERERD